MTDEKRIVEIAGIKMELDTRTGTTKKIESYKVGDNVKVLTKSYSSFEAHPGVIIGFDEFKELPTIIIAYINVEYNKVGMKFVYLNDKTEDIEIVPLNDNDILFEKQDVLNKLDAEETKLQGEVDDIRSKKKYFQTMFKKYFADLPTKAKVEDKS